MKKYLIKWQDEIFNSIRYIILGYKKCLLFPYIEEKFAYAKPINFIIPIFNFTPI